MDNLPVCKKCCFCLPLRYGLLIWGYMKLISGLLLLTISLIIVSLLWNMLDEFRAVAVVVLAILISEIIIHIIFIIGAHEKNVKLLRVYYWYATFIWILTILFGFITTALLIVTTSDAEIFVANIFSYVFSLIIHAFLLLSLRSEIIKLRSNCPYRFVKNSKDTEGTIKHEEEMSDENGPKLINEKENS